MDGGPGGSPKPAGKPRRSRPNPVGKAKDMGKAAADTAANAAKNGMQGLVNGLAGVPGALKGFGNALLGKAASAFGVSRATAAAGIGLLGLFGGVGGVTMVSNYLDMERIYRQEGYIDDCAQAMYNESQVQGETVAMEGDEMMYAEMMYGILANLGFGNKQCAGAVSSMAAESALDPTAVEGIYSERYQIGPRKAVLFDGNTFTAEIENHFRWLQEHTSVHLSVSGYTGVDGRKTCGLGLLQYTGGSANGLMSMAEAAGKNWYDFDVQMAYMLSDQSGFGARLRKYKELSADKDVETCADLWTQYVEMGGGSVSDNMLATHKARAKEIEQALGTRHDALQSEYASVASGVQDMAGSSFEAATVAKSSEVQRLCGGGNGDNSGLDGVYDNTGMARLMTLYCYQDHHSAEATATGGNPQRRGGTKLYQELRDTSPCGRLKNDPYWNSCDRGVATAVICSGADDNFCLGGCGNMITYLVGSDKWELVGPLSQVADRLEPGDICIYRKHVIMYTGTELNSAEGGKGEISSASYGERYPGMGSMRQHYSNNSEYRVFRYVGSFDGTMGSDLSKITAPADHH